MGLFGTFIFGWTCHYGLTHSCQFSYLKQNEKVPKGKHEEQGYANQGVIDYSFFKERVCDLAFYVTVLNFFKNAYL